MKRYQIVEDYRSVHTEHNLTANSITEALSIWGGRIHNKKKCYL
jgi:hypothetical protein